MTWRWPMLMLVATATACGTLLGVSDDPEPVPGDERDGSSDARSERDPNAETGTGETDGGPGDAGDGGTCDASSDPNNCGTCGRTCNLNGACVNGKCERFVVFVTSSRYKGDFGAAAADSTCTAIAHDAGLGGSFRVWIGAGGSGRFTPEVVAPYRRTDNVPISAKWPPGDAIENPINVNERRAAIAPPNLVWSDLYGDAAVAEPAAVNNCQSWGSPFSMHQGGYGDSTKKDALWTRGTSPSDVPCDSTLHLYCVETP